MIKAIIVDDELLARNNLQLILQKYCMADIEVIGEAANVTAAHKLIKKLQPQLVFLDIEMGAETGFDLIARFTNPSFQVIFVTAFDQYAIKALKICALDYLLKPHNIKEIIEAVGKAKKAFVSGHPNDYQNLLNVVTKKGDAANQIAIPVAGGYKMVAAQNISFLRAEKEYTYIHSTSGEVFCSSINLGYYEDLLMDFTFYRIHHSYIINKHHLKQVIKGEGGEVVMASGEFLPVSRRRKTGFLQWLTK